MIMIVDTVSEYDEYSIRVMGTVDSKGQYRNWWLWWPWTKGQYSTYRLPVIYIHHIVNCIGIGDCIFMVP